MSISRNFYLGHVDEGEMNRQDAKDAKKREEPDGEVDLIAHRVIGAAIEVHRVLGPGFLEAVYEEALCVELSLEGVPFVRQVLVGVRYKGRVVGQARLDLVVAGRVVVELKATEAIAPIHIAQALSYLKATRLPLALLITFNVPILRTGIKRVIHSP
jgi:GxxExxY protein